VEGDGFETSGPGLGVDMPAESRCAATLDG